MKEDKVGRERNNKKAKPRRDAPREECTRVTKAGDGEEELLLVVVVVVVVGRAVYPNKEKSERDKDIQAQGRSGDADTKKQRATAK